MATQKQHLMKRVSGHIFHDLGSPAPMNPARVGLFRSTDRQNKQKPLPMQQHVRFTPAPKPAPVIKFKSRRKQYKPMSLLELLEWQFLCWTPALDNPRTLTLPMNKGEQA